MFWESLNTTEPLSGRTWLSSGCFVLRADTRENSGGKIKVMSTSNLTAYSKQLARQWILHMNTTIRKVEIKAKFTKLTNRKKIEG